MTNPAGAWVRTPAAKALAALVLVLLLGAAFHAEGTFFRWDTHRDMIRYNAKTGILACGMTLVIITGGIDLAVGSVLALASVLFALMTIHWGWAGLVALPLCLLAGAGCGAVSGTLVGRLRVQPFIATLAMMVFARGLAKYVCLGKKVSRSVVDAGGSYAYKDLPPICEVLRANILGGNVAVVSLVFLLCLGLTWLLLARMRYGRYLYAIGGNEEAARLSGVPVVGIKVLAYAASGFFAALAGVLYVAEAQQGDSAAGVAYELTAIAMVVIGGTSLAGGRGGVGLTLLGVLIIGYLDKILSINAVKDWWRDMFTGAIIVGAVLLQSHRRRR